jgi:hypothetical protein
MPTHRQYVFGSKPSQDRDKLETFLCTLLAAVAYQAFLRFVSGVPNTKSKAPGDPEPDIGVRIRRRVVQIERERTGIRAIVPVAAADEAASHFYISLPYT